MHTQENSSCGASSQIAGANYRLITSDGTSIDPARLCLACNQDTSMSEDYLTVLNPDTDTESENESCLAVDEEYRS
eukprot:11383924-Prorocentrum_lima.AAC.1